MLQSDFSLKRNYKNGKASINGFLDDYSFTCEAFIALYQVTFDENWLELADSITEHTIQHFSNLSNGTFFYTSTNDNPLIARKTESSDNVIPASNSSMALVLYRLGLLMDNPGYIERAKRVLTNVKDNVMGYPTYYANWAVLMDWMIQEPYEVAITGDNALDINQQLNQHFLPNCIILGSRGQSLLPLLNDKFKSGSTLIHVCQNKTCQLPVKSAAEALGQIK
jgi:uncharacterized protein